MSRGAQVDAHIRVVELQECDLKDLKYLIFKGALIQIWKSP